MIDAAKMEKMINKLIEEGHKRFIIMPFGSNGKIVLDILKKNHIEPLYIVDNYKSDELLQIKRFDDFNLRGKEDLIILMTAENKKIKGIFISEIIKQGCIENFANIRVFDGLEEVTKNELLSRKRLNLNNLLPELGTMKSNEKNISQSGIKIRIVSTHWNIMESFLKACKEDDEVDILVIGAPYRNIPGKLDINVAVKIIGMGIRFVHYEDYDISEDKPDVLIIGDYYISNLYLGNVEKYAKQVVAMSMFLIKYTFSMQEYMDMWKRLDCYKPDYYIFDRLLYKQVAEYGELTDKIVEAGNPKFDGIFQALESRKGIGRYNDGYEKLAGKKTILWTTDHNLVDGRPQKEITLDLYGEYIFRFAIQNKDIGLIFRPHPNMINELLDQGIWSKKDIINLKRFCAESSNIIFDDSVSYNNAYAVCDAIITDPYCGILCSALPTLKPICVLKRSSYDARMEEALETCYYHASNCNDIERFLTMVMNDEDPLLIERKKAAKEYISNFDGKNGLRLKDLIKFKYKEHISEEREVYV